MNNLSLKINSQPYWINNSYNRQDENKVLKRGVTLASAIGVAGALAHICKKQGFSLSPKAIKNTSIKDWAIFKIKGKKVNIEAWEILELAGASVAGGLIGGALLDDKKHFKAKLRESVNQFLGNVAVPVACVSLISRLYKSNEQKILKTVPQFKENGKFTKICNTILKKLPFSAAILVSLGTGIWAGNRVSNLLNEKIFHKKVDRKIKGTDFAPHVDDLGVAISIMSSKDSLISTVIQRVVPIFLCVPGIQTGKARDY